MTDLVPADQIEKIVGAPRHRYGHIGRVVSAEQMVYILHSQSCLDSGDDLRECAFSQVLDGGIEESRWEGYMDQPVILGISRWRLIPVCRLDEEIDHG